MVRVSLLRADSGERDDSGHLAPLPGIPDGDCRGDDSLPGVEGALPGRHRLRTQPGDRHQRQETRPQIVLNTRKIALLQSVRLFCIL